MPKFVKPNEAANTLRVCLRTLRRWEAEGKINTIKTPSGQRRYDIEKFIKEESEDGRRRATVIYARVSTRPQLGDLHRQVERLSTLGVAELGYDKFIVRAPKNNTSKNAELMQCPECQSTHVNKNGQKKGKQNYICVGCGRQFIDCYQPHKGYSEEVKRECLKMYVNGMGFRAIERICMSTSHQYYKLG
jgi:hypothetical protein